MHHVMMQDIGRSKLRTSKIASLLDTNWVSRRNLLPELFS